MARVAPMPSRRGGRRLWRMKSKSGARLNRRTTRTLRGKKPRSAPPKTVAGPKSRPPEGRASSEVRTWSARAKPGGVSTSASAQNIGSALSTTRRSDVKHQLWTAKEATLLQHLRPEQRPTADGLAGRHEHAITGVM